MTTLYIDRKGAKIDVEGDTVVVRTDGERRGTVPLKPLERVVVASSARLTTRCLARLAENGTGLLILSGRQRLPAATLIGQPNGDIALRMAQYALMADETMRAHLARGFVVAKVSAQIALLRRAILTDVCAIWRPSGSNMRLQIVADGSLSPAPTNFHVREALHF